MDERTLVEAARTDPDAFARLYDHTMPELYRFALSLTRDHARAEDVTSETYRRALGNLKGFEVRDRPFVAWLFTIARNIVRDSARKSGRELPLMDHDRPCDAWPGEAAIVTEQRHVLGKALKRLPFSQRRAIVLRYGHEWSYREVGERMGKSEAAAKQMAHRGILRLRELMKEFDYDG